MLLVAGCATSRINWEGRVGIYTFDQAVLELGPPDKEATLRDHTLVAEWLTRRGGYGYGSYAYYPYAYAPYYPYGYCRPYGPGIYTETYVPDYFLRLTFDPSGKLKEWKKYAR